MNASKIISRNVVFEVNDNDQFSMLLVKALMVIGLLSLILAIVVTIQGIPGSSDPTPVVKLSAPVVVPVPMPPAQASQPQATPIPHGYSAESIDLPIPVPQPVPTPQAADSTK
jgi:hypothetical protein